MPTSKVQNLIQLLRHRCRVILFPDVSTGEKFRFSFSNTPAVHLENRFPLLFLAAQILVQHLNLRSACALLWDADFQQTYTQSTGTEQLYFVKLWCVLLPVVRLFYPASRASSGRPPASVRPPRWTSRYQSQCRRPAQRRIPEAPLHRKCTAIMRSGTSALTSEPFDSASG